MAFKRLGYPSARDIKCRTRYWSEPDIKNTGGQNGVFKRNLR
nr:MAG TPA: hypothetical protein [Caudoviricetes sp.]